MIFYKKAKYSRSESIQKRILQMYSFFFITFTNIFDLDF